MKTTRSRPSETPGAQAPRHFHRKALCEARLEFGRLDSGEKIVEACLLTAMGALGVSRGLACIARPESDRVSATGRGVNDEIVAFVRNNFPALERRYFSPRRTSDFPFHVNACVIEAHTGEDNPLGAAGIRALIGWRIDQGPAGLMGLGEKILGDAYLDEEIDFLLNLGDNMILAMQWAAARRETQGLKRELEGAGHRAEDLASRAETAKMELEGALFRLSGFNDIFNELGGVTDGSRLIESFLLVLMGIFSAGSGSILYVDEAMGTARAAHRGLDGVEEEPSDRRARERVRAIFASVGASAPGPSRTVIAPSGRLDRLHPFLPGAAAAILFNVDDDARGALGLGKRLTGEPYGALEHELLSAFAGNFLVFLENGKSFETIQKLGEEREKKTVELEKTVHALSASRRTIAKLEKTGERIASAVSKAMARSSRVSLLDMALIIIAGVALGLVYNFASPGGVRIIPESWSRPSPTLVDIDHARRLIDSRNALFVDARPAEFYNSGRIQGAVNLPPALFDFIYMMRFTRMEPDRPIVVYGRTISRRYDEETAFRLSERGHGNVLVYPGGVEEWEKSGGALEP